MHRLQQSINSVAVIRLSMYIRHPMYNTIDFNNIIMISLNIYEVNKIVKTKTVFTVCGVF